MARFDSFVMLAGMRTGSNFLEASLNALDGVTCHGEAFNPRFAGSLGADTLCGIPIAVRDAEPAALLSAMRVATPGVSGFRFFHDHDARVLPLVLGDPRVAKIVLTRNPLDSHVSRAVAQATGQWKLTDVRRRREAKVTFDPRAFRADLEATQEWIASIRTALQTSGQTAFWIDYDELGDVGVLNGLAAWLGVAARLEAPADGPRKQNPAGPRAMVSNPEAIDATLQSLDPWGLADPPAWEPRRSAGVAAFLAAGPLLYMPVRGGPEAEIEGWLPSAGPLAGDFTQKTLRQWRRSRPGHRSFSVLRHPLLRAFAAFERVVFGGDAPEQRMAFARVMGLRLPPPGGAPQPHTDDLAALFLAFLRFARLVLCGQAPVRPDGHLATQAAVLQGFAQVQPPDHVLREESLAAGLAYLSAEAGLALPPFKCRTPRDGPAAPVSAEIVQAVQDAYRRDFTAFGFAPLPQGQSAMYSRP